MSSQTSALTLTNCPFHNNPYEKICLSPQCLTKSPLLCTKCNHSHPSLIISKLAFTQSISTQMQKYLSLKQQFEQRSKVVSKIVRHVTAFSQKQYDQISADIARLMKAEKDVFDQKLKQIYSLVFIITKLQQISAYFRRLDNQKLLALKLNMSNAEGIKRFRTLRGQFEICIKPQLTNHVKTYYNQLQRLINLFITQLGSSKTTQLKHFILKKDATKRQLTEVQNKTQVRQSPMRRQPDAQKQNLQPRQVPRQQAPPKHNQKKQSSTSKSESSFSQFVEGIFKFFG